MATAHLIRNTIIDFNGERLRMLRPFEDQRWQLENIQTGRLVERHFDELLEGIRGGQARILLDEELNSTVAGKNGAPVPRTRWEALPEKHKEVARRRHNYVKATINLCRTRSQVKPAIADVAKSINDQDPPSFSSTMMWISQYIRGGCDISALAPHYRLRGRKAAANDDVKRIVDTQIEEHYLTKNRNTLNETLERVAALIARKNKQLPVGDPQLPIPSLRYLRTCLSTHTPYDICCARYGVEYAARKYQTVLGFVRADVPLERVEIDHTVLDLMVVDQRTGLPLGRPTLTVALDFCTRSLLGFNVGFEPPNYLAVSRCLTHALLPKTYLKARYPGIKGAWQCYGAMEYLVVDNGLEFHAKALEDAAGRFGITIQYCPRAKPWFKGAVERFIGTMNRGLAHGQPGTTFANIFDLADYDPKKTAVITLEILEEQIHTWVVDYYHQKVHTSIHKRPATAWAEGTENMPIPLPVDIQDFESAFAIPEERRLDKNGIKIFKMTYNGQACTEYRLKHGAIDDAKIRYVPDNLGYIYLQDPVSGEVAKVPVTAKYAEYANGLSLWQHAVCNRYAIKHYESNDIAALGEAKLRIAELVSVAISGKKLAKQAARFANAGAKGKQQSPIAEEATKRMQPMRNGKKSVLNPEVKPFLVDGAGQYLPKAKVVMAQAARGAPKKQF